MKIFTIVRIYKAGKPKLVDPTITKNLFCSGIDGIMRFGLCLPSDYNLAGKGKRTLRDQ